MSNGAQMSSDASKSCGVCGEVIRAHECIHYGARSVPPKIINFVVPKALT